MGLQAALSAAQHLADTTGHDVTVRLQSDSPATAPAADGGEVPGTLVVRPQEPQVDAAEPTPPAPPGPRRVERGMWVVTLEIILDADAAQSEASAVDQAVTALFADGPVAEMHATITDPAGRHRRVRLRPLEAARPDRPANEGDANNTTDEP
ncbi:hypothetical protein [Jannaschia sp. R86511]|uniref:hypothetical protein n=1 Tax=Jannaschia sp. R86511 TaxID=3093853 RepID=UPI0036D2B06A